MSIKKEKIAGEIIDVSIKSTSLKSASYNLLSERLSITFNSGTTYEYRKVPMLEFTKFRLAKSQGTYFNKYIAKDYKFKKVN
jgi:hypothetical protein